eukprot:PhF_6_TR2290/c1_g1_i1/m.3989
MNSLFFLVVFVFCVEGYTVCNESKTLNVINWCRRTYDGVSCKLTFCVLGALTANSCEENSTFGISQNMTSRINDALFCNVSSDSLSCSVDQMDGARRRMNTCWRARDIPCSTSCFQSFTTSLVVSGCNYDRASRTNYTPSSVCRKFHPPCSNAPNASPHNRLCTELGDAFLINANITNKGEQFVTNQVVSSTSSNNVVLITEGHDFDLVPVYIGVGVGIVILLMTVGTFIVWRLRSRVHSSTSPKFSPSKSAASHPPTEETSLSATEGTSETVSVTLDASSVPEPSCESTESTLGNDVIIDYLSKGRWHKGKVIGRGASGTVYMVVLDDGSLIAMKRMSIQEGSKEDVHKHLSELFLATKLNHPNIVRYFYAAHTEDPPSLDIFMEFVQGGSLGNLVKRVDEPLNEAIVRRYARQ